MTNQKDNTLLVIVHPFYSMPIALTRPLIGENLLPDYSSTYPPNQTYLENIVSLIRNHQGSLLCLEEDFMKRELLEKNLSLWRPNRHFKVIGTKDDRPQPVKGWDEFDSIMVSHKDDKILCAGGQYYFAYSNGKDFEAGCLGTVVKRIRDRGYNPLLVQNAIFS